MESRKIKGFTNQKTSTKKNRTEHKYPRWPRRRLLPRNTRKIGKSKADDERNQQPTTRPTAQRTQEQLTASQSTIMTKNQRGGQGKRLIKSRPAFKHGSKPIQKPSTVLGQQSTKGSSGTKKGIKDVAKGFKRDKRNKEFDDQVLQLEERNMGRGRKPGAAKVVAMSITLQPSLLQETMRQAHQQTMVHYADTLLEGETREVSHSTEGIILPSNQQQRPTSSLIQNRGQHVNKFAALDDDDSDDDDDGEQRNKKYQLQLQPSLLGNLSSIPATMGNNGDDDDDL